jgi:hypothetical protein
MLGREYISRIFIVKNIEFDNKNNVLIFHIKWSKTIQYGERKLKIPVTAIPGSLLCPVYKSNSLHLA